MKNIRRVIAIFLLLILYAYIVNISNFPSKLLLYSDSSLNLRLCPLLKLEGEVQTSATKHTSNYNLSLSLGNTKLKDVNLKIADKIKVVPVRKVDRVEALYRRSYDCSDFLKLKILMEI
jgi:hypothetical protein